jgi:hypothetical protein
MVTGALSFVDDVEYYRIDGIEGMEPFLMTVVSDSNLWMFVSSTGALTAGRVDADHALFPYETDDRIHQAVGVSGPVTVIARTIGGTRELWRPFGRELTPQCTRSISKSVLGDRLVFEERHLGWGIGFRSTWAPSRAHGWVRTVELISHDDHDIDIEVLDGFVDVMPAGIDALTEQIRSNLVNAYKRSEIGPWGTLAVFSVESLLTDRAEPAESLTASVVWSSGFPDADIDLDGRSIAAMVEGRRAEPGTLITGRPGAYLLRGRVVVPASESVSWMLVADTGLGHADVRAAVEIVRSADVTQRVIADTQLGSRRLHELLGDADALQSTADPVADAHHLSNVLFNSMRGGVFPYGHRVPVADLANFVTQRNRAVAERHASWLGGLGAWVDVVDLRRAADATGDTDLVRLVLEYLPITFSRRHGDPSRPWNRFSINVDDDAGNPLLEYEGNWRDIFQNWEALLHSYPSYFGHVVAKFVNASTIDGYNPYRISRDGIDWEVPDPDDPWSHIGYWGDHQIIYLLRLLEAWQHHEPGAIGAWLTQPVFVYADVPYAIADHDAIVRDPRNTITFDEDLATAIERREEDLGADGRLRVDADGLLLHVGLLEKLVVPALAKLTNLVPGGGIWLNTQRPEWNDANNALAGPGLSMVTLAHLCRYLRFVNGLLDDIDTATVRISGTVAEWLTDIGEVVDGLPPQVESIDDRDRRTILDAFGRAGTKHRHRVRSGSDAAPVAVQASRIRELFDAAANHLEQSIRTAKRADGLYHSYNRVSFPTEDTAQVDHLGPMLEGQVAVLSSGTLDAEESLAVIDALFDSDIYRPDQLTFMLYPAQSLPSFLDRNRIPEDAAQRIPGLDVGIDGPLAGLFVADPDGELHFRADLINANALGEALDNVDVSDTDREALLALYEEVFDHDSFTGRSGSMYGYEGLGSVYWHMVAKLLLATQEAYWSAVDHGESVDLVRRLGVAYRRIRSGLGFMKDPVAYGAIPTDCYSHTPAHAGAQQPGMTGQVKEEVLTRLGEFGVRIVHGRLRLTPGLIPPDDLFSDHGLEGAAAAQFTVCSIPMTLCAGTADDVTVERIDGARERHDGLELTAQQSRDIFSRSGVISRVEWRIGAGSVARWSQMASAPE